MMSDLKSWLFYVYIADKGILYLYTIRVLYDNSIMTYKTGETLLMQHLSG